MTPRLYQVSIQRPMALAPRRSADERDRRRVGSGTRAHARALPPVHPRSAALEADTPQRRRDAALSPSHRAGSPELVWRRAARAETPPADEGLHSLGAATVARSAARPLAPRETAPESPAAVTRPAPRQLAQLDPALVDRLADDVIRRIEKRARIERERRGL